MGFIDILKKFLGFVGLTWKFQGIIDFIISLPFLIIGIILLILNYFLTGIIFLIIGLWFIISSLIKFRNAKSLINWSKNKSK